MKYDIIMNVYLHKLIGSLVKNKKLLKTLETDILFYALANSKNNARGFITRVFGYLRANLDLLEKQDYKKLYDECLIFLNWSNKKDLKCRNSTDETNEIVADIMLKRHNLQFDKETVEHYLKFRKDAWNSGYYDKLFE